MAKRTQKSTSGRASKTAAASKRASRKAASPRTETGKALRNRIVEIARSIDRNEDQVVEEVRDTTRSALRSGGAFFSDAGAGEDRNHLLNATLVVDDPLPTFLYLGIRE